MVRRKATKARSKKIDGKAVVAKKPSGKTEEIEVDDQTILLDPDDVIIPPEGHFLHDPDEGKICQSTVATMLKVGVLQNIIVWRDGKKKWYVVVGRDRVRHAREAKKIQVEQGVKSTIRLKCTVRRGNEVYLLTLMGVENAHRRKVDAYKQAEIMQRILDHGGRREDLAVSFKMGAKTIQRRLGLLNLSSKGQAALKKGKITPSAAEKLSTKERAEQDKIIEKVDAAIVHQAQTGQKVKVAELAYDNAPLRRIVAAVAEDDLIAPETRAAMLWTIGKLSDKEAMKEIVGLETALDRTNNGGRELERRKSEVRGTPAASSAAIGKTFGAIAGIGVQAS